MDVPVELKYTEAHEWVRTGQDGVWTVGITDHAQDALGDIVSIELPEPGQKAVAEAPIAVIESVKAASDIHAPVAGEITEVNTGLAGESDSINRAPYESWLFRIKPHVNGAAAALLNPDQYAKLIES
jgi:glycine cleavage system H protein